VYLVFSALDLDLGQLLSPAAPPHFLRQSQAEAVAGSPLYIAIKKLGAQDCQGFCCFVNLPRLGLMENISAFLKKAFCMHAQRITLSHVCASRTLSPNHFSGLADWENKTSPVS
jgi:hypothetical protein